MVTFYSVAVSGYWAFGNNVQDNILENLMPNDEGVALVPTWLLVIAVIFILLQLFAIALVSFCILLALIWLCLIMIIILLFLMENKVYCQVAYEILEKKSADVRMGVFSLRNLLPRLVLRSMYIIICAFVAAMLPFFGDINALVGAIGFIPLDFILPMLLYNISFRPAHASMIFLVNNLIMIIFTFVGIMGTISSVRQIVIDAKLFKLFSTTVVD